MGSRTDEPPAIRPAKLSKRQFKRILAEYEDPVNLSGKPMSRERRREKQKETYRDTVDCRRKVLDQRQRVRNENRFKIAVKANSGQALDGEENLIEFQEDDFEACNSSSSSSDSQDGYGMHYPIKDPWKYMQSNGLFFNESDDEDDEEIGILMSASVNEGRRNRMALGNRRSTFRTKSRSNYQESRGRQSSEAHAGTISKRHEQTSGVNHDTDENETSGKETAMFHSHKTDADPTSAVEVDRNSLENNTHQRVKRLPTQQSSNVQNQHQRHTMLTLGPAELSDRSLFTN